MSGKQKGSLHLIVGPMFAGKTSTLLATLRRYMFIGHNCFPITHTSDKRYSLTPALVSHNKEMIPAHATETLAPVREIAEYKAAQVVAIEEAHFFNDLYEFVLAAVEQDNKTVIVVGLNGDYKRRPIGQIGDLYPLADSIQKIDALCAHCSTPTDAIFTKRLQATDGDGQILVGGSDSYEAVCRTHYLDGR